MWYVPTQSGDVDLEDATVISVVRRPGELSIALDSIRLRVGDAFKPIPKASVLCEGVRRESVARFVGNGIEGPVQDKDVPLDLIEVVEFEDGNLELQGYRNREAWFVWRIACGSVRLMEGEDSDAT